jgi:hypothetical protein
MGPEIKLGQKVKDLVSGFVGIVVGLAVYQYSNPSALVESTNLQDGKPNAVWLDQARLEVIE